VTGLMAALNTTEEAAIFGVVVFVLVWLLLLREVRRTGKAPTWRKPKDSDKR